MRPLPKTANQNYRSIFEGSVDGIFRTDLDGHYLEANPALAKIYKYASVKEFLAHVSEAKTIYVDETRRDAFREQIASTGIIRDFEAEVHCADGSTTWINENARAIRDELGNILFYEGIVRDISAQRKAQVALEHAIQSAEAANRAKSEFLANMSHEIRTPMNAILGFAELLKGLIHEPRPKSYLQAISLSGQTLLALINDILDLSKIEAGKLGLEYGPVNVAILFRDIQQIFLQKAEQKGIELSLELAPDLPPALQLDEIRMRQILFNLVGNAIKFTDEGYVKVSARIEARGPGDKVDLVIEVQDTGVGIPEKEQGEVFVAFSQQAGQDQKKYGGTGLGLTITRRLVEMMNGVISLESQVGKGSTFRCRFPGTQTLAALGREAITEETSPYELSDIEPCTVLVADDMAINRDLLRAYFFESGHRFLEVSNGQEAVDLARLERPAMIFMDVRMPVMDGVQASRLLKADPELKNIPVVVITASTILGEEAELKRLCDGFLRKPVSRQAVAGEMRKFLPLRAAEVSTILGPNAPQAGGQAVERLDELVPLIAARKERFLQLKNAPLISGVERFGNELAELGKSAGSAALEVYGKSLAECASTFDVVAMERKLAEFEEVWLELTPNAFEKS